MTNELHKRFIQSYDNETIPWDTGTTPPEIEQIVRELPPGKALDLGCGTGTNIRYLLEHDWQVDGVDFVPKAIEQAKSKLADFVSDRYGVYCHDVTRLVEIDSLRAPYDLVVDIGCGHGIPAGQAKLYARDVASLMKQGGIVMLYAHQPVEGRSVGWTPEEVHQIFAPQFDLVWEELSTDTTIGFPSGWYKFKRR